MINIYPMISKAAGNILRAYQDFMRYEGVPECLHRDLAPEQQVQAIINLNRDMMVKDTFSERGSPNQNPAEALGVKPLKDGTQTIITRTGCPPEVWPWVAKYIADVHNHCAHPLLKWKTPISKQHGYTLDISAFLNFQFWEKVWFKVDEKYPNSKEIPGYWAGVSDTVGDALTYFVYNPETQRFLDMSVIHTADPS